MKLNDLLREKELIDTIIRKEFEENMRGAYHPLYEAMEYSLFSGGKRVRPVLLKWCAEIGSPRNDVLDKSITAIEYIHTYSLIHDDLPSMDDDDMRRGKPSLHRKFGEGMAILAGDALLTEAFFLLAKTGISSLSVELARSSGVKGMVGGQAADIKREQDKDYINKLKTASLFRAASVMGGIVGGAGEVLLDKLSNYGINLGMAFQLKDDLLDKDSSEQVKAQSFVNSAKNAIGGIENTEKLVNLADFVIARKY